MSNLKLWDSVCKTDPRYTVKAKKGAYQFTSITPMYQFKKATETFGIQGIGWGIKIDSETFTEKEYGTTIILSYDAILFFNIDGKEGQIPVHASEKSCYQTQGTNGYMKIDDEVRKKVVTNAKTKGLSELGLSADVLMGEFDNPDYIEFRNMEESLNKADDFEEESKNKTDEFNEWCKKEIEVYSAIKNQSTLDKVLVQHRIKIQGNCRLLNLNESSYMNQFNNAHTKQTEIINEAKQASKKEPKK